MLTHASQVSIRAFLPVWVFLYVIQFLLMPVIARDYWLSLFLGNSLYLVAFGYYIVITFLGYNGNQTLALLFLYRLRLIVCSSTFSSPHTPSTFTHSCLGHPMVCESLRLESTKALCTRVVGWCGLAKVCVIYVHFTKKNTISTTPFHVFLMYSL